MVRAHAWTIAIVFAAVLALCGTAPGGGDEELHYVGTKTCKKCHFDVWQSWSKTKMAHAFEVLKPNSQLKPSRKTGLTDEWIAQIKENKTKANPPIDPEKDYTRDESCLKCHTTGYGEPGGYVIPDPKDKKARRKAEKLEGVGCESCHGPGSKYVKIFEDIQDKQRQYTREELYAAGMTKIGKETCASKCHNKDSPLVGDDYVFDYEKRKTQGTHEHKPLKLRKD